jgi:hypothetical protein
MSTNGVLLSSIVAVALGGCGLLTPEMQEWYEGKDQEKFIENTIVNNVKCELTLAYENTIDYFNASKMANNVNWLKGWGATVNLRLAVDEKSAFTPGITGTHPLANNIKVFPQGGNITTPRSFALSAGLSGTADATRTEIIEICMMILCGIQSSLARRTNTV